LAYSRRRQRGFPFADHFFASERGTALAYSSVHSVFSWLRQGIAHQGHPPRIHDLRHTHACRSMESAIKLVERFIAGVTKPARPSTPEAETNPHQYDGPPRTAEQVAA
jgi:integrase